MPLDPNDELVENDRGLWIWRGNDLVGRVPRKSSRKLTLEIMRQELADLQGRIEAAIYHARAEAA